MAEMFLYNGVKLPKLPASTKASSLIICLKDDGEYVLYAIEGTPMLWTDGSIYGSNNGKIYIYYNENDEWIYSHYIYQSSSYATAGIKPGQDTVWSNKDIYARTDNSLYIAASTPVSAYCLTFSSPEPFTLSVYNKTKNWDGTLYYSTDGNTWPEWDGTTTLSSAEIDRENKLFMRGSGNSVIIGDSGITVSGGSANRWVLQGRDICCYGSIECLLDYEIVENEQHPSMGAYCYYFMFSECSNLVSPPELPAIVLSEDCYAGMFFGCVGMTLPPTLPATSLSNRCYREMFRGCTKLVRTPSLPATTLGEHCYYEMFHNCTSLTSLPELPATILVNYCYRDMFRDCTSIRISETQVNSYQIPYTIPSGGSVTSDGTKSLYNMFTGTGGTFTGTPEINTTYYLYDPNYQPELPKYDPATLMLGYLAGQKARQLRRKLANTEDITDAELVDGVLYIRNANAKQLNDILEVT